jgi:hypothetical protein
MITNGIDSITKQLDDIEQKYNESVPGSYEASIFALSYLLILSSWIEECRDDLSCRLVDLVFVPDSGSEKIKKEIQRINGFKFSEHFKKAITRVIGEHGYNEIKANCNEQTLILLESSLGYIWNARCDAAHKTFKGMQANSFAAPSIIKQQRNRVFEGLKELELSIESLERTAVTCC